MTKPERFILAYDGVYCDLHEANQFKHHLHRLWLCGRYGASRDFWINDNSTFAEIAAFNEGRAFRDVVEKYQYE